MCRKSLIQSLFSLATVRSPLADRFPSFHWFLWLRQEVWVGWRATANRVYNVFNDYVAQSFWESDLCCPKSGHSMHGLFTSQYDGWQRPDTCRRRWRSVTTVPTFCFESCRPSQPLVHQVRLCCLDSCREHENASRHFQGTFHFSRA